MEFIHSLPPWNKCPSRTYKPWSRSIPEDLHELPSRWLGGLAPTGPIRAKQQNKQYNEWVSILSQSWETPAHASCSERQGEEGGCSPVWGEAEEVMKRALRISGEAFNRCIRPTVWFKLNDLVYIEEMNIKMTWPLNKLAQWCYGPFEVLCQVNETSYELKLPNSWHLKHSVFHRNLLLLHRPGHSLQQLAIPCNPTPLLDNSGDKVYSVEAIANSRKANKSKGRIKYLVKWLDYGEEENTWEPGSDLNNSHVQGLIAAFHVSHPNVFHPRRGVGQWGHWP